ncbi:response regulator transcription factor [Saccharomonospora iraqiensis]|uniref:response regulator transcription factor n=2 Tax=Pseudonocardiaceae TaxID=2070 RepID=UPI00022DF12D|nr:response regulator transcription factor [Saccharomonospora iraqiensis]
MIRVLIADDQDMVRAGFRMILDAQDDIEVVADVADGVGAVRRARELRPDVCLLDIRMPGIDGLEATGRLAGPDVADPLKVVVVTTFDLDEYVHSALDNGASGFLLKDAGPALLVEAVRAAARGDALVSPQVTVRLLRHFAGGAGGPGGTARGADASPEPLTDRELDVTRAAARGLTNGEIGGELYMSLSTVKTHLASVQHKLGVRNRVEIAAWAWRNGVMDAAGEH